MDQVCLNIFVMDFVRLHGGGGDGGGGGGSALPYASVPVERSRYFPLVPGCT